ncbi:hypothetical protein [Nannocystis punicea]|uniref:Uncharacterized protein n=1 Tax=Nannocystis punicea TaxID=2995304 RepID=A0ABY7H955_9BACT|nr:hypothetical protein [Nannocystis poenicansa]WAS95811.1 hypothetical protein O0S08_06575 [Nannocystis poenicansa]
MSIEQARAAFDRADPPTGLAHLLEAWRTLRLPRIAELIQHVSDALVAAAPPIEGKTDIAYVEAFEALAPGDPVDLGRFLARPWPCKSTHLANLWLRATSSRPDDPRLVAPITRFLLADPTADNAVASKATRRLAALGDVRAIPDLRALVARHGTRYFEATLAELERREVHEPAPNEVADIAAIEARYAAQIDEARRAAERRAQLFAALLADPLDPGLKRVYGDWLTGRGDPRGQLIALQLARGADWPATYAADLAERELLRVHRMAWSDPIDRWFRSMEFVDGFFAGGMFGHHGFDELPDALDEPAWRFVRTLEEYQDGDELLALLDDPRLAGVRTVGLLADAATLELLVDRPRALTELRLYWTGDTDVAIDGPLARGTNLPGLRTLAIDVDHYRSLPALAAWLRGAPVIERLDRIALCNVQADEIAAVASRRGPRVLDIIAGDGGELAGSGSGIGWTIRLTRERDAGPFRSAVARDHVEHLWREPARWGETLVEALARLPRGTLADLRIESSIERLKLPIREQLTALAREIAPAIVVPWEQPEAQAETPARPMLPVQQHPTRLHFDPTRHTSAVADFVADKSVYLADVDDYDMYRSLLYALGAKSVANEMTAPVDLIVHGKAAPPQKARAKYPEGEFVRADAVLPLFHSKVKSFAEFVRALQAHGFRVRNPSDEGDPDFDFFELQLVDDSLHATLLRYLETSSFISGFMHKQGFPIDERAEAFIDFTLPGRDYSWYYLWTTDGWARVYAQRGEDDFPLEIKGSQLLRVAPILWTQSTGMYFYEYPESESVDGLFIQAGIDARTGKVTGAAISRSWT